MAKHTQSRRRPEKPRASAPPPPVIDASIVLDATEGEAAILKLKAGSVVFGQGEAADAVFYVMSGRIQLTVVSEKGKEGIIALFGPGDFFGEGCLSGQPLRLASAICNAASHVIRVEKATMHRLLHDKLDFSEKFMAFLITRNIEVEADLVDHLFNSSEKRLARLLLLLANVNNDGELRPIAPKISQEILAARVGTTRARINFFLNKFRKLGLIEYNGTMKVNTALLNIIAHD